MDNAVDAEFEVAGDVFHRGTALGRCTRSGLRFGFFQLSHAYRIVLENLHGCSHRADFIAAPRPGNLPFQFSLRQRLHARAELRERTADAATDDSTPRCPRPRR